MVAEAVKKEVPAVGRRSETRPDLSRELPKHKCHPEAEARPPDVKPPVAHQTVFLQAIL